MYQNEKMMAEWNDLIGELEKRRDRLAGPWTEHPEIPDPELALQAVKADRNLLFPLRENDIRQLDEGDGQELEWKMRKANSSAALALNVFHALRDGRSMEIAGIGRFAEYELEKKLPVFQDGRHPANLDVHLKNGDCDLFVESKFTEPFSPLREECREGGWGKAYQEEGRYVDRYLFEAIRPYRYRLFRYYDAPQIVRHAMALYREVANHPETYRGKKVVLMNLAWELANPQNRFPSLFEVQIKIWDELNEFGSTFRNRMRKLFSLREVDFDFIYLSYQDFLERVSNLQEMDRETAEYVRDRYLFLSPTEESGADRLNRILHSLSGIEIREGLIHDLKGREIDRLEIHNLPAFPSPIRESISVRSDIIVIGDMNRGGSLEKIPQIDGKYQILDSFNHYGKTEWIYLKERQVGTEKIKEDSVGWNGELLVLPNAEEENEENTAGDYGLKDYSSAKKNI